MATAQELRQLLKEDAGGRNLYEHLTETLMRVVLEVSLLLSSSLLLSLLLLYFTLTAPWSCLR